MITLDSQVKLKGGEDPYQELKFDGARFRAVRRDDADRMLSEFKAVEVEAVPEKGRCLDQIKNEVLDVDLFRVSLYLPEIFRGSIHYKHVQLSVYEVDNSEGRWNVCYSGATWFTTPECSSLTNWVHNPKVAPILRDGELLEVGGRTWRVKATKCDNKSDHIFLEEVTDV